MSGAFGSQQWMYASGGFYPYELDNSLKFEDGDSSYLSWTPSSDGNRKTWTWSGWIKRSNISSRQDIFGIDNVNGLQLLSSDLLSLEIYNGSGSDYYVYSAAKLRDTSSWYHIVAVWDSTNSTASDRIKLYLNGERLTSSATGNSIPLNAQSTWNSTTAHSIGRNTSGGQYFDGYMAEINFIDGTALDPSSFGETKEGIWVPKNPTGLTYGTNGFRLPFTETTTAEGFNTVTYTGNGATQSIEGVGFEPDLVWIKNRGRAGQGHVLHDAVRGHDGAEALLLQSDSTAAETHYDNFGLTTFNSDGFTVIGNGGLTNLSSDTYVAWNWKANGAGESNTDGTTTSTVSVNEDAGFSIATYTGTGATATVGHGLSKAPNVTIIKPRNFSDNWIFTHDMQDGSDDQLYLNLNNANSSPSASFTVTQNASTIGLTSWNNINDTGDTYVMYCFTEKDGFSKFGKYTGNGSANGSFVFTGFRPAYVLIKQNSTANWTIYDAARDPDNAVQGILYANLNSAENTGTDRIDFLSNGFKWRESSNDNTSGFTHYYMAFAEQPFKYSNAR
jgi:hypothetical protein